MTESPEAYGERRRGITAGDVERAADVLFRAGERPTIEKVRAKIGRGSPNTINPLLDAWWKRLASRLDAGPAALHRLPEPVAHLAEALWMQALDEGRHRATQEFSRDARSAAHTKHDLEVRSHVLALREGELESRLKDRERNQAALEVQVQELTVLIRKDRATIEAQSRRIADLENQLLARVRRRRVPTPKTARRKKSAVRKRR
jgi:Plasmid replication region DNA-binding N-term